MTQVLDHGYVKLIETWGSDERIIEAARMSTDKGFKGWGPMARCAKCGAQLISWSIQDGREYHDTPGPESEETICGGSVTVIPGDEKLLSYLYNNRHMTPFEMAGAIFEIKAPIFVFREWHRHRTQSYNEMSARYIPLPDENYIPTKQRIIDGAQLAAGNRQAQGMSGLDHGQINAWLNMLEDVYTHAQNVYEFGLNAGIPKELARLPVPVARYSRMRVSCNLRNWLQFCELRDTQHAPGAQLEIRMYADTVGNFLSEAFPRTMALFRK